MATKHNTIGHQQADNLNAALSAVATAALPGSRDLYVITDVKPGGGFITTQENVLIQVSQFLASTKRLFKSGNEVMFETRPKNDTAKLVALTEGGSVLSGAEHHLANLMVCSGAEGQFAVPKSLTDLLLRCEHLNDKLPEIKTYARRPVFDDQFKLRGPGWHADAGILVHGQNVDPTAWTMPAPGLKGIDRLPPRLRSLLRGFCFKSDADLANTLAALLTLILMGRYVSRCKPVALIDGNMPGLGKTLLVLLFGVLADGLAPRLVRFTPDDDELHKRLCAHLRAGCGSVVGIDNAKVVAGGVLSSPTLEASLTDPSVALRILGKSELYTRPNDLLWCLTMNDTKASTDLVSRGLPIRLEYEGDPAGRKFAENPVEYAQAHRLEILAELAGMVTHWNTNGRVPGTYPHRFREFAAEVGGILAACGFPEFLANMAEAAGEFSAEGDELTALAEYVLGKRGVGLGTDPRFPKARRLSANEWVPLLEEAGVREADLAACKSARGKACKVGHFFAAAVGRTVVVANGNKTLTLTVRRTDARARGKLYYFEVSQDGCLEGAKPTSEGAEPATAKDDNAVKPEALVVEGNGESWD